jgi:flagellum-specific ATP synthase
VDVLESISRLMIDIVPPEHRQLADRVRRVLATYRRAEDLITIGAYVKGTDAEVDYAIECQGKINTFLKQEIAQKCSYAECVELMKALF